MAELLPTVQAGAIQDGLLDYLTTTFALTDDDARSALLDFLSDPVEGIFKGPYLRLRLPFRPAEDGWRDHLDWYEGPTPYGHQAAAFARLTSRNLTTDRPRPLPTLVTTGTGSGKTEAFLYPIVDHVLRAKRAGVTGTKALLLYPMNALANDQAQRIATMISTHAELGGITAALYTGQDGPKRTVVSKDGLITDRAVIRSGAPDILLTNYKMLDQMLLRHADARIWEQSAVSLQYLVLDEFHTYDGAQGTDVSMLLRRLGLRLKSHWADDDPTLSDEDRDRPLGRITPVATSATLGDKGDPGAMLDFATTVFGEEFPDDAVITESRLSVEEWRSTLIEPGESAVSTGSTSVTPPTLIEPVEITGESGEVSTGSTNVKSDSTGGTSGSTGGTSGSTGGKVDDDQAMVQAVVEAFEQAVADRHRDDIAATVIAQLGRIDGEVADLDGVPVEDLVVRLAGHPFVSRLLHRSEQAVSLRDLDDIVPGDHSGETAVNFVVAVAAALSQLRAAVGRAVPSIDLHLWIRELTRVDRFASVAPSYRWSDDAPAVDDQVDAGFGGQAFPAIYCRHCGRSGWGIALAPTGHSLDTDDHAIRRRHRNHDERFRPLIHAATEIDSVDLDGDPDPGETKPIENLRWFHVGDRSLYTRAPADESDRRSGLVLPVLTHVGDDAGTLSESDTCPSCHQRDGIRFLGSAIATLLSVTLSSLFGDGELDQREKKSLVFTDSVQDAAHRAGFIQSRSHSLTFRAVLQEAIGDHPISLDALADEMINSSGDDPHRRYRLLPPALAERHEFAPFWQRSTLRQVPPKVKARVRKRLQFDAVLEFGLHSRVGRTLELTGAAAAQVEVPAAVLATAAEEALDAASSQTLDVPPRQVLISWARGILTRMRERGAIGHDWLRGYQLSDGNRWTVTGGRPRSEGMPAFGRGRAAPGFPKVGGGRPPGDNDLDPVASPQSWYALWTARTLGVTAADGATLARLLLHRLTQRDVIQVVNSNTGAQIYQIAQSAITVTPITLDGWEGKRHLLSCDVCRAQVPGTVTVVDQLEGAPCLLTRCGGHLQRSAGRQNFYREMYAGTDARRVIAREHTSLLLDETRLAYENGFKGQLDEPQSPNVLVATPTLEMGIDIGDLSAVMLASLPRSIASYLQRVGRAGRLTGNSLNLAFVTGRGDQLPRLGDPLSVINGSVRPPATYLDAEEILRRQYLASVADRLARDPAQPHPQRATDAMAASSPTDYLTALIGLAEVVSTGSTSVRAGSTSVRAGSTSVDGPKLVEPVETTAPDEEASPVDEFLAGFATLGKEARQRLREWAEPVNGPGTSALAHRVLAEAQRWQGTIEDLQYRLGALEQVMPEVLQRAESPAATQEDKDARQAAEATHRLIKAQLARLRGDYWISVLEEYGLFPNYTLLDDSVTLDVSLSWIDPDTGGYEREAQSFSRGSANALRELAPGATFYARGNEIKISAVDLGRDADAVRPWVFCPDCGFAVERGEGTAAPAVCPRCGSAGIAAVQQEFKVVELDKVSASLRRDEATIDDGSDERIREHFAIATAADIDEVDRQWFVQDYGFGVRHVRNLTIRWLNLGRRGGHGGRRTVAGNDFETPLFRVCASCGQLDTSTRRNSPYEHRMWCPLRTADEEDTETIALSRTLTTDGLVIRLPASVVIGDNFALPSLAAALQLGLREKIGGAPDHLAVAQIKDPAPGSGTHDALLLHDVVPGGTGYLADLADPETFRSILVAAWQVLVDCPCEEEKRASCHRCLLPFALGGAEHVSRLAAARHLHALLTAGETAQDPSTARWDLTEEATTLPEAESVIEQKFRTVFRERLEAVGAAITEVPGVEGNRWTFTLGAGRTWTLEPQRLLLGTKPDFLLECDDTNVPDVAIYCDGWQYHASAAHNRLADDAEKRATLRDSGRIVLGISWADLEPAQATPSWFHEQVAGALMAQQPGLTPVAIDLLRKGPLDLLAGWVQNPQPVLLQAMADALPFFLVRDATARGETSGSLGRVALDVIDGGTLDGQPPRTWVWAADTVALAARAAASGAVETALVLDDRPERVGEEHKEAWRTWLRLGNLLNLGSVTPVITTRSRVLASVEAGLAGGVPPTAAAPAESFSEAWQELLENAASDAERNLLTALAARDVAQPELGVELPDGLPLAVSWPGLRMTVSIDLLAEDEQELRAAGWTVVSPAVDEIEAALVAAEGRA